MPALERLFSHTSSGVDVKSNKTCRIKLVSGYKYISQECGTTAIKVTGTCLYLEITVTIDSCSPCQSLCRQTLSCFGIEPIQTRPHFVTRTSSCKATPWPLHMKCYIPRTFLKPFSLSAKLHLQFQHADKIREYRAREL